MRNRTKTLRYILCAAVLAVMFAVPVSANSDWIVQGDAIEPEDAVPVTEQEKGIKTIEDI